MSSFYLLSATTVTHWFDERRGLALALVLVGFNLGYIGGGPLAAWLITTVGWRSAYAMLGGGCGLIALVAALYVRLPRPSEAATLRLPSARDHAPDHPTGGPTGRRGATLAEALVDPRQWCLNFAWLLLGGLAFMLTVHIVPFARDHGVSLGGASLALTAYGMGSVVGRVTAGALSDRIGTGLTMRIAFTLQIMALVALLWLPSRETLLGSLATFGAGFAAADTMIAKAIPEVFGMRAIGAIMGVLTLGWRSGAALGPVVAGFLYDATGSYSVPFGAAPLVVGASWALFATATSRRRRLLV